MAGPHAGAASSQARRPPCKIAVMGAGAVGCYYGGLLARAGHDVVLIGRAAHVEAIQRDGLRFESQGTDEVLRIAATTDCRAASGAQLVLFSVKSTDTESAAARLQPWLEPDALLLTLQNGVDNADRLRAVLAQQVAAAVVYVAVEMAGPGHLKHHGRGELLIEPVAGSEAVVRWFTEAGVPTDISDNVRGSLWAKLILNCAYNAISAIGRVPYGEMVQSEGVSTVMRDIVAECVAVAKADGVVLPGDIGASVRLIAETMPMQHSSTAQDLARGKRSEIDHLNGFVVRRGEALGVPTPVNRALHALVKLIEQQPARDASGW